MRRIPRTRFIAKNAMDPAAAGHHFSEAMETAAGHFGMTPGCQIFPIREQLIQDFDVALGEIM